ncbi:hypothetical protein Tco_1101537 [Tanacetum coccineum]
MLAPRSAKALHEKVLLKGHGIRKLLRSSSLSGTLFWIIAELSSLKKADEICSSLCFVLMSSLRKLPYFGIPAKTSIRGIGVSLIDFGVSDLGWGVDSSSSSSLSKLIGVSESFCSANGLTSSELEAHVCIQGFIDPSHSSALSSVSHNSVSSDVADESCVPSGSSFNALTEEIVAYEKESDETHDVKMMQVRVYNLDVVVVLEGGVIYVRDHMIE